MKKNLGQNFLGDKNILAKIIEAVSSYPDNLPIVEVGTGSGILTEALATAFSVPIISYEIDADIFPATSQKLSHFSHVKLILEDFLKATIPLEEPFIVVANIPYYITSPILEKCLQHPQAKAIFVMVQKELSDRMVASPGKKAYSSFSLFCQTRAHCKSLFNVSRNCFFPVPDVDSAFIELHPTNDHIAQINDFALYNKIIKCAFWGKRKTLANCLSQAPYCHFPRAKMIELITSLGHDPMIRGEKLSLEDFIKLSNTLPIING